MSELVPSVDPKFDGRDGALYAVPLGEPPQHGVVDVDVLAHDGTVTDSVTYQFNCYDPEGTLP